MATGNTFLLLGAKILRRDCRLNGNAAKYNKSLDEPSQKTARTGVKHMKDNLSDHLSVHKPELSVKPDFTEQVMKKVRNTNITPKRTFSLNRFASVFSVLALVIILGVLVVKPDSRRGDSGSSSDQSSIADKPVILPTEQTPEISANVAEEKPVAVAKKAVAEQVNQIDNELSDIEKELSYLDSELSDEALLN